MAEDRNALWMRLGAIAVAKQRKVQPLEAPVKMVELPGFREFEDRIVLHFGHPTSLTTPDYFIGDELSRATFGITHYDTLWPYDEPDDDTLPLAEYGRIIEERQQFEEQFPISTMQVDDAALALTKLGLDWRGDYGQTLHCAKFFIRQAEAALRGIMGTIPTQSAADLHLWEQRLQEDARTFQRNRHRR